MKQAFVIYLSLASLQCLAQGGFTVQQCMQYAVEHNHEVRQAELELDNYKAQKTAAIGRFLPAVEGSVGAQYNFGRAIDPETNGYTDVSTFYNGYSLSASLPLFDGLSRIHALRAAKAGELMGRSALRQQQDQTALAVMQAFANVVYYQGMVSMANEKVQETELLLRQTRLMEDVGRKSAADVAQVESQKAEADYELTRQQGLYQSALLELKKEMAWPINEELRMKNLLNEELRIKNEEFPTGQLFVSTRTAAADSSFSILHSSLETLRLQAETARHEWRQARSALYPSLSLGAGLNTTYFHTLHSAAGQSFSHQFKNNMGEYVGVTLSIPLFNRLQTVTAIRRAKNNYLIAQEAYKQKRLELEKLSHEAWLDWQTYQKQTIQMKHKVTADSIAYQLTKRQFEEGLSTAIDLRNTSAQLLQSKAMLLQCQLMTMVKEQLLRYYRGECLWEQE